MKLSASNPQNRARFLSWLVPWLMCVIISLLVTLFVQRFNLLFALDAKIYDAGLASREAKSSGEIVIVGLTDDFVKEHHVSQMPRDKLARLINALTDAKPAVIAVDVWLDSLIDDGAKKGDEKLRAALLRAKKAGVPVVLAQLTIESENKGGKGTTAHGTTIPFFAEAATDLGGVYFIPDTDKLVRLMPEETINLPSLPYLAAWHSLQNEAARQKLKALRQSNIARLRPLDFLGSPDAKSQTNTPSLQIHDAQKILDEPYLAPFLAAQKIVFIGATFPRSTDFFQTSYDNKIEAKRKFYGVEMLANATFTYRQGALHNAMRLSHESRAVQNKVLLLASLVAVFVVGAALRGLMPGILALLLCGFAALELGLLSALGDVGKWPHFWPPSTILTAALLAWISGAGWRQKVIGREVKEVREAFGGYVGPEILKLLEKGRPEMGGETREVAVLFCDIQGFTAISESLQNDPGRVLQMLNDHFEPLVEALKKRGAYVDNYAGDLVMALFGAPVSQGSFAGDVQAAVLAAQDFDRIISERNIERKTRGEIPIEVGIGVHCGPVVAGNMGTKSKMHYTGIGDTVNIAARVESETRHYPTRLLVTEEVTKECPDVAWQFVAETAVKGRAEPVKLYCVKV